MALRMATMNRKVGSYAPARWEHSNQRSTSPEEITSWEEGSRNNMSNNRNELIAYIKRLGYSEKIAEEVLRQKGDRISKSELLNYVVIAASKNKDVRTRPSADYLNNQDSFRKPDGSTLRKPLWKRKNHK